MKKLGYRIVKALRPRPSLAPIHMEVRRIWNEREPSMQASDYYRLVETEMAKLGYVVVPTNDYTVRNWPEVHAYLKQHVGKDHYTWTGHLFYFETEDAAFQFRMFCQ